MLAQKILDGTYECCIRRLIAHGSVVLLDVGGHMCVTTSLIVAAGGSGWVSQSESVGSRVL
ncbi:hypothetical protein MFTT_03930 [Mycolicibacterium fortuitum subsp. fortuitum]|nr:hypothetical protein [Mycolicibacterium fortuitum]BDD96299.1 hypothetical protein MFTT_03930 [Mycolicibacterium fortuitum subsp. fortuitum]